MLDFSINRLTTKGLQPMANIDVKKQTPASFIFSELIIFLSQIVIFFTVSVFTSDFLSDEKGLIKYSQQKINDESLAELGLMFLAIFIVVGGFTVIGEAIGKESTKRYISAVLYEMPKTIYVFGSGATGVMIAMTLYIHFNPETATAETQGFALTTGFFALMIFVVGCGLSYFFKRKTHIIDSGECDATPDIQVES